MFSWLSLWPSRPVLWGILAGEYNVFMFDDIVQYGTDVEGRVAGGGDVTYGKANVVVDGKVVTDNGFSVASKVIETQGLADLVAGQDVSLKNGSVGYSGNLNSGTPEYQKGVVNWGGTAPLQAMSVTTKINLDQARR